MKKILGLAIGILFTAFTYAQSPVKFLDASDDYDKSATTEFNFMFDDSVDGEDLEETAQYYTDYFTVEVSATEGGHKVQIALLQDDEMSRKVVMRYFVSLDQRMIMVNGEKMELRPFTEKFIEK